ncbi:Uu.00g005970.m01.CDS01 [Anthostomella pinea]|uniref:Uu.00g005970.m01.CDS01 n=1 Tax=Anthostomella pinea TaxID=933095 RepID=A0AAI8YIZ0_9PEZI|nr:Uu.00g005970.m01.CDS01 [Anthostomella pinea]
MALGGDMWSAYEYLANYLGDSLSDTDMVAAGDGPGSFWNVLYESLYLGATTSKTIDASTDCRCRSTSWLTTLSQWDTRIDQIQWVEDFGKLNLQWRHHYTDREYQKANNDYVVLAVPLPQLRKMRLPKLGTTTSNAIQNVEFGGACKHFENPIFGRQTNTDINGIGTIHYSSYCLNSTGPATILGSYTSGNTVESWSSMPEMEHAHYIVDAMVEIHGEVACEQWTDTLLEERRVQGRRLDQSDLRAAPALHPGVFQTPQQRLGLIDGAKSAVDKWMGRWIDV